MNYCHHMLRLFEEDKDINKEKINIKESIDYLVDAWERVTEETIALANAIHDYIYDLEEILIEDILNDDDIIKLV